MKQFVSSQVSGTIYSDNLSVSLLAACWQPSRVACARHAQASQAHHARTYRVLAYTSHSDHAHRRMRDESPNNAHDP